MFLNFVVFVSFAINSSILISALLHQVRWLGQFFHGLGNSRAENRQQFHRFLGCLIG